VCRQTIDAHCRDCLWSLTKEDESLQGDCFRENYCKGRGGTLLNDNLYPSIRGGLKKLHSKRLGDDGSGSRLGPSKPFQKRKETRSRGKEQRDDQGRGYVRYVRPGYLRCATFRGGLSKDVQGQRTSQRKFVNEAGGSAQGKGSPRKQGSACNGRRRP